MRRVGVEIFGNPASAIRAFRASGSAAAMFGRELTQVGVSAEKSAQTQVNAAVRTQARLREQIAAYEQLGRAGTLSYREQIANANLLANAQMRLARSSAVSAKESQALLATAGRGTRGQARESEAAHRQVMGRFRERARIGPRLANITGFGPGFLAAGTAGYALDLGIRSAIKFNAEMLLLRTQAGASMKEVKGMSAAVLQLATSVGQTPEALARGLYHIESYGYRGAKALKLLRLSAMGAAVGHDDIESTTNALLAMTKRGSKIGGVGGPRHAMGLLDAIIGAGNMRMSDLTAALGTGVMGSAANFGITMPELGSALAVLTHSGQHADEAATRLRMTFSLLAAGSPKANKELKTIGLTTDELATTIRRRGLLPALQELKYHLEASGMSAVKQAALLSRAFGGGRSGATLMTLLQQLDNFKRTQTQIAAQTGRFGASWAKTQKSAAFATNNFKAALSVLGITLGAEVLPGLTKLMIRFTTWISNMVKTGKLQRDIHQGMVKIGAAAHLVGEIAAKANAAAHAFGGWKHVLAFLVALKLASVLAGWAAKIRDLRLAVLGAEAAVGAGGKTGLLASLLRLKAIGPITVFVTLAIVAHEVIKKGSNWIDSLPGAGFVDKHLGGNWLNKKLGFSGKRDTSMDHPGAENPSEAGGHGVHGALHTNAARRRATVHAVTTHAAAVAEAKRAASARARAAAAREAAREHASAVAAAKRQHAEQFRLLGLGPTGDALVPTKQALKRELGTVESTIKGTFLDTSKQRTVLGNIRRLLSGQLGALSKDVRAKIKEMLDGLKGQLNDFDGFNLTKAEQHRRSLDRRLADRYRAGHSGVTGTGPGGSVHHTHHHTYTIVQQPGESSERAVGRAHWRLRTQLA